MRPSTQLLHYVILATIGEGGMGKVYRARDTRLGREVAIKTLPEEFSIDSNRLARFEREAKLLASLNHPNIAAIHGLEESDGTRFLVLELVEGETLVDRIKHGPIPVEESLKLALQIVEALEAAHERGVIHRDLKPANVKVTPDGRVKVLDFGLAKVFDQHSELREVVGSTAVTFEQGMITGTPPYMSPEQVKGSERVDGRTDVFSFGSLLYEMLSGRRAFQGNNVREILAGVLGSVPDFSHLPKNLDPNVSRLVRRCLEKDPRRRWYAAGDLRIELESLLAGSGRPQTEAAGTKSISRRRAAVLLAQGVAAGAAVAGGLAWALRSSPAPQPRDLAITLPEDQAFTRAHRRVIALSHDGQTVVYVANHRLYRRPMAESKAEPIAGTDQDPALPFFSPDGKWVGFWSARNLSLNKVSINGGSAVPLSPLATLPFGAAWEAGSIFFGGRGGLYAVPEKGGKAELKITLQPAEAAHSPQVLRNGELILFTIYESAARVKVVAHQRSMNEPKLVMDKASTARYLPSGHLVYVQGWNLLAVPFDIQSLRPTGPAFDAIEGVMREEFDGDAQGTFLAANYAVSAEGTLVYVPRSSTLIDRRERVPAIVPRDGGPPRRLHLEPARYHFPRVSPRGNRIAVEVVGNGRSDVGIYDLSERSPLRLLKLEGGGQRFPAWSRDGQRVAYGHTQEGQRGIFWQRPESGPAERLTTSGEGGSESPFSFSRDTLALGRNRGREIDIWTLRLNTLAEPELFQGKPGKIFFHAAFHPNGHWLAYTADEEGTRNVYVAPYPKKSGAPHLIAREPSQSPVWSPNGDELFYYQLETQRLVAVRVRTHPSFEFEKPVPLPIPAIVQQATYRQYDVMPNGTDFLVLLPTSPFERPYGVPQINVVENWFEKLKERTPSP